MPWVNPTTVSTGDVLTASRYNSDVVANWNMYGAAWTDWTPTLSGGWANGNATTTGKYLKIGRFVSYWTRVVVGSTTTKGTTLIVSLPVTAAAADSAVSSSFAYLQRSGSFAYEAFIYPQTTTTVQLLAVDASGTYAASAGITATVPFAWATNDSFYMTGTYEASS